MRQASYSAYETALRYVGVAEIEGEMSNPLVMAMLKLDNTWPQNDEVPWCSAFVNWIAWHWRLPRSKDLRARSWLTTGTPIALADCEPGFDIVVLWRGGFYFDASQENMNQPGHVGFFAGVSDGHILLLGGNQGDKVSIVPFVKESFLGARRLF